MRRAVVLCMVLGCSNPAVTHSPTAIADEPSSLDKIDDAERAGAIDHDTALVSQLLAIYAPERLPAALVGARPDVEATVLVHEIAARLDHMTPELQGVARPFLLRPTDPASFWNHQPLAEGEDSASGDPITCDMGYLDDAKYPIRYWYCKNATDGFLQVRTLAATVDSATIYDREKKVMVGHVPLSDANEDRSGDGRLDVYYIPAASSPTKGSRSRTQEGGSGITIPLKDTTPSPDYIIIDSDRKDAHLAQDFAHELFHAFQDSFPGARPHNLWWNEASAVWAEDYIFPAANDVAKTRLTTSRWAYFDHATTGPGMNGPLDIYDQQFTAYGAFLWPYFLTRIDNVDPTMIGKIWDALAGSPDALAAMAKTLPTWKTSFKRFALANWNKDVPEAKLYELQLPPRDQAGHYYPAPLLQVPLRKALIKATTSKDSADSIALNVAYTSVAYIEVSVDDSAGSVFIPQLTFDLSAIKSDDASVQAIVHVAAQGGADSVEYQDWSSDTQKRFCRDQPGQNVTRVVLIVANSNPKHDSAPITGAIKVNMTSACDPPKGNFSYLARASIQHGQEPSCVKQRKMFDEGATGPHNEMKTKVAGNVDYSEQVHSDWTLTVYKDSTNPATKERVITYEIASKNQLSLHGQGTLEKTTHMAMIDVGPASGEDNTEDRTTFQNTANGPSCNGPPPAKGKASGCPNAATMGGLGDFPPPRQGRAGSLAVRFPASGPATYEIHWEPAMVPMSSSCSMVNTDTPTTGKRTFTTTTYNAGSNSMDTVSDTGSYSHALGPKPAAWASLGWDGTEKFWRGTFNGTQSKGGDITANATGNSSTCDKPVGQMAMLSAPCDFSTGDSCDLCTYSATMQLRLHVDVPAQASSPKGSTAPAGSDACAQLSACCSSLPSVAQPLTSACTKALDRGDVSVCSTTLDLFRGKHLCP